MDNSGRDRFLQLTREALEAGALTKLTLGKYRGADPTVRNLFVRAVTLKAGPHLAFVWRHATRDVTQNLPPAAALAELGRLIGHDFQDAHLFTPTQEVHLETQPDGRARVRAKGLVPAPANDDSSTIRRGGGAQRPGDDAPASREAHDQRKHYAIPTDASWLRALGVTNDRGVPREGMGDKLRQIQKFAELLGHLLDEAFPARPSTERPLKIADMGSGKGYLTFALAALLGPRARVTGIETRPALVDLCNRHAREHGLADTLTFAAGTIADTPIDGVDVLIALHACDTATDDALARGIRACAPLLVVAPCCQKELRRQLKPAPVLAPSLRHGIFQERHAEFATDALRALLLEYAGYRTKVFEFISTEHTAKNVMIAAVKAPELGSTTERALQRVRELAGFYGITTQALARHLRVELGHDLPGDPSSAAAAP